MELRRRAIKRWVPVVTWIAGSSFIDFFLLSDYFDVEFPEFFFTFSTFAAKYLDTLNAVQLESYDKLINRPSNDWDIYHWITGMKDQKCSDRERLHSREVPVIIQINSGCLFVSLLIYQDCIHSLLQHFVLYNIVF